MTSLRIILQLWLTLMFLGGWGFVTYFIGWMIWHVWAQW